MNEVALVHGRAHATIASLGAEARRWAVGGRELLWPGDPEIWAEVSPILYPIVGWTRDGVSVKGERYGLGLHGFARFETFAVEASEADFVRLKLIDNQRTRAVYPFAFALALEYRLSEDALAVAVEVENPGPEAAPYACGLHPGFHWPLERGAREGALVRFEKAERAEVPTITSGGLIGKRLRRVPLDGCDLPLSDALFATEAVCFLNCESRALAFHDASGASVTMEFPGFDHAALWTRPGAPFLGLEAWTSHSDPEGFAGNLFEKPSMRVLQPGAKARHEARYTFRQAGH